MLNVISVVFVIIIVVMWYLFKVLRIDNSYVVVRNIGNVKICLSVFI